MLPDEAPMEGSRIQHVFFFLFDSAYQKKDFRNHIKMVFLWSENQNQGSSSMNEQEQEQKQKKKHENFFLFSFFLRKEKKRIRSEKRLVPRLPSTRNFLSS